MNTQEPKNLVHSVMLAVKPTKLAELLMKAGKNPVCPWCGSRNWNFVATNNDEPIMQLHNLVIRKTEGDIIHLDIDTGKTRDVSVVMQCQNCGLEHRFNFQYLCQKIANQLNSKSDKK